MAGIVSAHSGHAAGTLDSAGRHTAAAEALATLDVYKCKSFVALPESLGGLERLLTQSGAAYVGGDAMSVADLALWRAVGWLSSGVIDGIPPTYIASAFPRLWALHVAVDGGRLAARATLNVAGKVPTRHADPRHNLRFRFDPRGAATSAHSCSTARCSSSNPECALEARTQWSAR